MIQQEKIISFNNRVAVKSLKALGYPLANIRKALHKLIGIGQPEIAKKLKKSRQCITHTVSGLDKNPEVQEGIADVFEVPVQELFEDVYKKD